MMRRSIRSSAVAAAALGVAGLLLVGAAVAQNSAPITLAVNETLEGALEAGDARDETGAFYDDIFVALQAGEEVQAVFDGQDFAAMRFGAGSGRTFEARAADAERSASGARIVRFTAPSAGRYTVRIVGQDPDSVGPYALTLRPYAPPRAAEASAIGPGARYEGRLADGGARLGDEELLYDLYRLEAKAGERFAVTLTASGFPAFLDAPDLESARTDWEHDGVGGARAGLRFVAEADGVFDIRVVAADADGQGPYAIAVDHLPVAPPPPRTRMLRPGRAQAGAFDAGSPTTDDFRPYAYFAVRGRPGDVVTARMNSDAFDPLLEAGADTPAGFAVTTSNDDDPAGGTNAKLTFRFDRPGLVMLRASALAPGAAGAYEVAVDVAPSRDRD